MKICYLDFWPGFDPNSNWFSLLFKDLYKGIDIDFNSSPEEADVIFASSFGNERHKIKNSKAVKIFYTGENERPDLDFADYSLSFDFDTYGGRNYRLPHWYLYVNWWNDSDKTIAKISPEELYNKDPEEIWNRKNFCCIMIGNPVQNRMEVAKKLNEYNEVHGYGKVFGNYFDGKKGDVLKHYRFNICFENSITEGYVTEKLLEAKAAGCIPIYYGDDSFKIDFNENCAINYNHFESPERLLHKIKKLNENEEYFKEFVSRPLFNRPPDLNGLYEFLKDKINYNET